MYFGHRVGFRKFGDLASHGRIGDDFGDFMIGIRRRDHPKSFLPTLNGKKAEIRSSGRFSEIRRFGSSRPNRLTISVIL